MTADDIAKSLETSARLLHRYLDGVQPDDYHHQPVPGANSVAWILGHLVQTERRLLSAFGAELPDVPAGFDERFAPTRATAADQSALEGGAELKALFDDHRARLAAAVRAAPPEKLAEPKPTPTGMYSNLGELAAFIALHTAMHAGQVTAVRRSLNYPVIA